MTGQYNKYFVITGGPGVGKTTLLAELERRGFIVVPEDARRIIKEQVAKNGEGLPWKNKKLYAQLLLKEALSTYQFAQRLKGTVFFDRGIADAVCYMTMEGMTVTKEINEWVAGSSYSVPVFILPPWKEIYQTDGERKQTWAEALETYEVMKQTYTSYGYPVVEVPKDTVVNRADFILMRI